MNRQHATGRNDINGPRLRRLRTAAMWLCACLSLASLQVLAQNYPSTLSNTASLTLPGDTTDPDTADNSSTDQNTLALVADISVAKTLLSAAPVVVGGAVRYQVVVTNAGPSRAQGITLNDSMPPQLQNVTWTCAGSVGSTCGVGSGSGSLALQLDLMPGGSITVLVNATAPLITPSTIAANTATIVLPVTISDPTTGNNTSTTPTIAVTPASIVAVNDTVGPVNGRTGNATAGNVLGNDTLSSAPATPANTTLSVVTPPTSANITLDTGTGAISIAAGTPAGSYSLTYQLCETSNPGNCASATATIQVAAAVLVANPDTAGPIDAVAGGSAVVNVLANDTLDGAPLMPGGFTLTPVSSAPATINADGTVDVEANAMPGTYTVGYTLCEVLNPGNCVGSTVTVTVTAAAVTIDALDDSGNASGTAGGVAVDNVLLNDLANGAQATTSNVMLTVSTPPSTANIVLNTATGAITVAPNTAVGSYSLTYQICLASAPSQCDTATVSVNVTAALLAANDDTAGPVDAATGGTAVVNVLTNDTFNGALIPAGAVLLTPVINGPITINANGSVDVAAGATAGVFTVAYTICEAAASSHCATASVAVTVAEALSVINAVDDAISTLPGNAHAGNVFANDTLDGDTPNAASVTLTQLAPPAGISIGSDGTVSIAANVASGSYTTSYTICQIGSTTVCDTASVTIIVNAPAVVVRAINDTASITAGTTSAGNVLVNDTVGGAAATTANATVIQQGNSAVLSIDGTGAITVVANAAPGTYTLNYQLCATASPTSCDTATVSVTVNAAAPTIDAVADAFAIVAGGSAATSVLINDSLAGAPASVANVVLAQTGGQPVITIAGDGTVSVRAGAVPGNYAASYQICDLADTSNCDTTTVTVTVPAPPAVIDAINDSFSTTAGSAAGNVLANDTVDGGPATTATASITQIEGTPELSLGADGTVSVVAGTAPGTYSATYRLCDIVETSNCDTASVSVIVTAVVQAIAAVDDSFTLAAGASGGSVLGNDTLAGAPATSANVSVSQTGGNPDIVIAADGTVSVAAGVAAGPHGASYQICSLAQPAICDSANVSVAVTAPAVVVNAVNDVFPSASGSPNAGNVLLNDTVGGVAATTANATITQINAGAFITIGGDGTVSVAGNTAAGIYTATYQLCQVGTGNCDTAIVTVNVAATAAVDANDDSFASATGSGTVGNALSNDTIDGALATTANVTLSQTTGTLAITIASDGTVSVATGTPAGTYSATYRICEVGSTDNCDTAAVTVVVTAVTVVIDAVNDSFAVLTGEGAAGNVLDNDTVDGAAANNTIVTVTQLTGTPAITIAASGAVSVALGTAAGSYSASYRLCLSTALDNCDTANVLVMVNAAVTAVDDAFSALSGSSGIGNVLINDSVRGQPAAPTNAVLNQTSGQAAITLGLDGAVGIVSGTAAGTYTATYQLCELLIPGSCDTATVTVTVTAPASVAAVDDTFSTVAGNATVGSVLGNDTVYGAPATASDVTVVQTGGQPAITISSGGIVSVLAGTLPGTYSAAYQACLISAPSNCDTANVSITVTAQPAAITAVDDAFSSVAGNANAGNVLGNDTVDGAAATAANVTLTQTAGTPAITIAADGTVAVAANAAAGAQTATYSICQISMPTNCASATVTVTVAATAAVNAANDAFSTTAGNSSVGNVLINDSVDALPATITNVVLTQLGGTPALVIAPDGAVSVAVGTGAGTYTGSYQICERANSGNCATATVTVIVNASVQPINAGNDSFTSAAGNASVGNVLTNDSVGGTPATTTNVDLLQTAGSPGITIATDGTVGVAAGTVPGTYTATYQICAIASPTDCATATVSVTVTAAPVTAIAVDDSFSTTAGNASVGNVLANDSVSGATATASNVLVSQLNGTPSVTIAADGTVSVPGSTAAGSYTARYRICEIAAPLNCDEATMTVTVTASAPLISAVDDAFSAAGSASVGNVLVNDTVNGGQASISNVLLTQTAGTPAILISGDGTVSVAAGTAAGNYTGSYQICAVGDPTTCATANVVITVMPADAVVLAVDDSISTTAGTANAGNVLTNDSVDGAIARTATVTLTQLSGSPGILIAANGTVSVVAGTAPGSYTASYQICQVDNTSNCDTANVTVVVAAVAPALLAVDDTFASASGNANVGNVLGNDTVDGVNATTAEVTVLQLGSVPPGIMISAAGVVSVASGTPVGRYTARYRICLITTPATCDEADVLVTVSATPVAVLAADDAFSSAAGNANAGNVLANDTLDGAAAITANSVLTQVGGAPAITIASDGTISVANGLTAGTYTATYSLCAISDPASCDTAIVTVTVLSAPATVVAGNDTFTTVVGSPSPGSVLTNDTVGSAAATPGTIDLIQTGGQVAILIGTDGVVSVVPGTLPGTYTTSYRICAAGSITDCATASVLVTVAAASAVISASADTFAATPGQTNAGNVLANDTVDGAPALAANVTPSQTGGQLQILIVADGTVSVVAGTAPGSYTASYQICQVGVPTNCASATVTVNVTAAAALIDAVDDSLSGTAGGPATDSVLDNDQLAGNPVTAATVVLTQTAGGPVLTIAGDGSVAIAAGTAVGSYTATYRICEQTNAGNCDAARVTVTVQAAAIVANDDSAGPIDGLAGVQDVINVLANDVFNGSTPTAGQVLLAPVTQGPLSIGQNGLLDVVPNTPAGTYLITYRICDIQSPSSCDDATVTVTVRAQPLQAVDDAAQVPQNTGQRIVVLGNDSQGGTALDATRATITQVTTPEHGAAVSNGQGAIVYTPQTNYSGPDTFQYTVCEVAVPSNCATATVNVTVAANQVTGTADAAQVTAPNPVIIEVLANDTVNGAPLDPGSLSVVGAPANGTATCAQGVCTYTPATGFSGNDTFTYRVCDLSAPKPVCNTGVVTITVDSPAFNIRLRLVAAQRTVRIGGAVQYTATAEHAGTQARTNDLVAITPPPGFTYIEGTMRLDGELLDDAQAAPAQARVNVAGASVIRTAAVGATQISAAATSPDARVIASSPITISGVNFDVDRTVTFTYDLRVGAGLGNGTYMSRGIVREGVDDGSFEISNWASAEVEIESDPVMDESLVLGSVFDDRDGNGIQSPGERGIAGVRIGSVEGLISTTDGYGRYHVIGIETGAAARGRNFILKVDTATLPAGTTFTTPNPRVRRITAGIPVRFDFGVRLPQRAPSGTAANAAKEIQLAPALFDAQGAIGSQHVQTMTELAVLLKSDDAQLIVVANPGEEAIALQRALAAQAALQQQADVPVDVQVRDGSMRGLLQVGDNAVQLLPGVFDSDAPRAADLPLLLAVADGIAARRIAAVAVPAGDPAQAQRRVQAVRQLFASRLPAGTVPDVRAAGTEGAP